jgi:transposase, IS6 family
VRLSTRRRPAPVSPSAFAGFRFPAEVVTVAVRWHLRYGLSYRDVEELLAERGVEVGIEADHSRLKHRLRAMRGLRTDRTAQVIIAGLAFVQNLRRGHYELATETPRGLRVALAFAELARAI